MSTAVSSMYSITIPKFASASTEQNANSKPNGCSSEWAAVMSSGLGQAEGSGDPLDFDLLAEYLLEDFTMNPTSTAYSFTQNHNECKDSEPYKDDQAQHHQEQSVTIPNQDQFAAAAASFADPLADAAMMLRQTGAPAPSGDLASDLVAQSHQIAAAGGQPAHQIPSASGQHPVPAPVAVPAPIPAPAPITAPAPLEHPGLTVPPSAAPVPTPMITVPDAASSSTPGEMTVHRHPPPATEGANKRPYPETTAPTAASLLPATLPNLTPGAAPTTQPSGKRQKSQAQIDRRRERNRILARRTRLRKKFFFESLQKEVIELQRENAVLKEIVKSKLDDDVAQKVLEDCHAGELPSVVTESCGEDGNIDLDQQDFNLVCSIKKSQQCFVITDPSLHDNPIVYASGDFLTLTGYSRDEVLGRNCRFLQGTDTSKEKVDIIRKGLAEGNDVGVCFINYTADGTAFWNKLFIAALRDTNNNIVNYIGVTVKVAGPAPDDPEAGKLLPGQKSQKETNPTANSANDGTNGKAVSETNGSNFDVKQEPEFNDAEGTVMAMDEVVSAAVANAPSITPQSQCAVPPPPQCAPPPPQCAPTSS
mmetsp:Transcript_53850/g.65003  ORF Transcript_53850/g.65003 Transcript_53850/m.65003 type:complete len:591 (+) Transcript_53850:150-1922(+)|eukprot:CAMPEP_0172500390 /NCGR_PEP_ID=MMETSP1066-20121228/137535_1 /TAXON_ID=671091 /ORGANISM="Coscinodiscus wailesii, Strain CCMP2513" /LENGTH=590 /DNA_ID=CAMNT_0013274593 /DNA_START=109 /DNA_END=1881 /DNA_ORIENTATION=-